MTTPPDPHEVECCPVLVRCQPVHQIRPAYRIRHNVPGADGQSSVQVEATWHMTLTNRTGDTMLGPVVKTVTLLPGQTVRLSIQDRASKFSYDTESSRVHREAHTSASSYYNAGMASAFSSLSSVTSGREESTHHDSSMSGSGGAGLDLGFFEIGGSVGGSSHDSSTTSTFLTSLSRVSRSQSSHVEMGTQSAYSTSVGYVATRSHTEGESEEHSEAATHFYRNENRCHAVNHRFHQLVEEHTITLTVDEVVLRVIDASASTGAVPVVPRPLTGLAPKPEAVSVLSPKLLATESAAREAAVARTATRRFPEGLADSLAAAAPTLTQAERDAAIKAVMEDLVKAGLVTADGKVTARAQRLYGWSHTICLPLDGVHVMSCLSECDVCEPELKKKIELGLERMALENEGIARENELMDKDLDHQPRCCPETPDTDEDDE
jgi:hypothetical protein